MFKPLSVELYNERANGILCDNLGLRGAQFTHIAHRAGICYPNIKARKGRTPTELVDIARFT